MPSWDMGYHSNTQYIYQYFSNLNPLWAKFVFTTNGMYFPDMKKGYACELGFGQGVSINMHALANDTTWYGNDFNPTQVSFARQMAELGHANVHLYDDSFEQFTKRDDLPDFDFIGIHGIWSWISPENQQYLIDFISKHLKVGGVLYISYNVAPGFTSFEPMRHLLKTYVDHMLPQNLSAEEQVQEVKVFVDKLMASDPACLKHYPNLKHEMEKFFEHDPKYVVAEYFNEVWDITHFSTLARRLDDIKVQYAASAYGKDMIDAMSFNSNQMGFLIPLAGTPIFEDTRDFMNFQRFRCDYFVKGITTLSPLQQEKAFRDLHAFRYNLSDKLNKHKRFNAAGDLELQEEIYLPVLRFFMDHKVHSFGEALDQLIGKGYHGHVLTEQEVVDALRNLVALNELLVVVPPRDIDEEVVKRCQKFNREFILKQGDSPSHFLASPVLGGALTINGADLICLTGYYMKPNIKASELAELILPSVKSSQEGQAKKAKPKDMRETADFFAKQFLDKVVPILKTLKVL